MHNRVPTAVVEAFRQCTALRELEFGLHAHNSGHGFRGATSLFRRILDVLPESRLHHVAFVLDLGEFCASVVLWATLGLKLSRACVGHGQALQVRIERYEAQNPDRPQWERMDYLDQKFWSTRLPTMERRILVQDSVRGGPRKFYRLHCSRRGL